MTGVITRYRLVIVFVLIMLAVGGVIAKTDNVSRHVRYIRTYVDCNVLGNCWEGMYEVGDNID